MNAIIITLIAIWTYPFIGYLIYRFTFRKPILRKKLLMGLIASSVTTLLGIITHISTTSLIVDWIFISSIYLTISTLLWIGQDHKNIFIKVFSIVCMLLVFSLGFLGGSIGLLGIGFALGEYEPVITTKLSDDLIYKETTLGNAIADYRGKRVEIFRTTPLIPIIEWRIHKKEYYNISTYMNKLTVRYKPDERVIYLSIPTPTNESDSTEYWSDIISF